MKRSTLLIFAGFFWSGMLVADDQLTGLSLGDDIDALDAEPSDVRYEDDAAVPEQFGVVGTINQTVNAFDCLPIT